MKIMRKNFLFSLELHNDDNFLYIKKQHFEKNKTLMVLL